MQVSLLAEVARSEKTKSSCRERPLIAGKPGVILAKPLNVFGPEKPFVKI